MSLARGFPVIYGKGPGSRAIMALNPQGNHTTVTAVQDWLVELANRERNNDANGALMRASRHEDLKEVERDA